MDVGDDATRYSECVEGSGSTCPQSGRAALEGGSKDNCRPQGNQRSGVVVFQGERTRNCRCSLMRISGVVAMLRNTALSASSTTQRCVTLSTSEAEYVAMAHGAKTALAKTLLKLFSHISVAGPLICMRIARGQRRWLKIPSIIIATST